MIRIPHVNGLGINAKGWAMENKDKTRAQLIAELSEMRQLVSELKKSEAMLRQAEESLKEEAIRRRILVEQSRDGIVVLDQNGKVYEANQRYAEMLGYSSQEVLELHMWDWDTQWTREELLEMVRTVDDAGDHFETLHRRKDGTVFEVEISTNGAVCGGQKLVFCVCRDISERKQAEKERSELEAQLRQSQKMETIGTLAGGIAHDFNNILGIIIGNTELALTDVPHSNPAHASLDEIRIAGLRAKDIVRQLLTFSRNVGVKTQPLALTHVVEDSLKFLRSTIPTTIEIRQDFRSTNDTIMADPTQVHQVMMNLCANAAQAMEKTGGVVSISVGNVTLNTHATDVFPDLPRGDYVRLAVSDTGPGIDPAIRDRVFDPYFTTKEVGKGSGMGLALVHGIVRNHNGGIRVNGEPGKGATFTILFPLVVEECRPEIKRSPKMPIGRETILFVDDEESIATIGQRMLERLGYTVETATAPHDALRTFREDPSHFDLVITDMTMPQMTGEALFKEIKRIRNDIPVIITTGYSSLIDEGSAEEMGFAAYLAKPIDTQEVADTIRKALDGQTKGR